MNNRLGFLLGLQELTSRYEQEVESAQRVFSEVHVTLEAEATSGTNACIPTSYHRIHERLQVLKVTFNVQSFDETFVLFFFPYKTVVCSVLLQTRVFDYYCYIP